MKRIDKAAIAMVVAAAWPLAGFGAEPAEWHGSGATARESTLAVARDQWGWTALWATAGQAAPAAFDPAVNAAVGVFLGIRPTGGYAAEIVADEADANGNRTVTWRERRPGPNAVVTQALTSPWVIRLLPRAEGDVVFREAPADGARR